MGSEDRQELVTRLALTQGQRLRRFLAGRVANRADIPDIMQEVYLRLLRVSNYETIRAPEAYLFTVAQHVALQHSLSERRRSVQGDLGEMLAELEGVPDADPVMQLRALQCVEILDRALDDLSPKARATFLLHRREGLTVDEISAKLHISRPMTKKYLVKALVHFRKQLQEHD